VRCRPSAKARDKAAGNPARRRIGESSTALPSSNGGFPVLRSRKACFLALAAGLLSAAVAGCSENRSALPPAGLAASLVHGSGTFVRAQSSVPAYMQIAFLMTDGSVLAQGSGSSGSAEWYKYVPDANGDYSDGTWSQVGSLQSGYAPEAFASEVLADGRLLIIGGEYNFPGNYDLQLVNLGAIYDPLTEKWTALNHPAGWQFIGDSPSSMLPNNDFIIGQKLTKEDATWNPASAKWTKITHNDKSDYDSEEGWTLLPDGTILTEDVKNATNSEIFNPSTGLWKSAGSTVVDLRSDSPFHQCLQYGPKKKDCYLPPGEIGPAILRPDGTVFATGSGQSGSGEGDGNTAVYTIATGKWAAGPDFPNNDNAGDSWASLMPSGDVLVFGVSGEMYLFDGTTFTDAGGESGVPLLLPTGQLAEFGGSLVLYTAPGKPKASWAPAISNVSKTLAPGKTYTITGTQFNGMSQAMAFGDEYQNNTNYPLVRVTMSKTKHVFYLRTHDHSTMGVATGTEAVYTYFDVPKTIEKGAGALVVVADGIASTPANVTIK
jgi:hypothetical protein